MTGAITAFVLAILFLLFRKFAPPPTEGFKSNKSIDELRAKYKKIDITQLLILFPATFVLAFVIYHLLAAAQNLYFSLYSDVQILVSMSLGFILVAGFAGMTAAAFLMTYFTKRKLGDDWPEYNEYNNMKYGFNTERIGRITFQVIGALTFILFMAIFDDYCMFRANDIIVNEFTSFGNKTYSYSDVSEIRDVLKSKAPNGNIVEEEHYVIEFNDGLKWNSRYNGFGNFEKNSEIINLVQEKTGKEIVALEFDRE